MRYEAVVVEQDRLLTRDVVVDAAGRRTWLNRWLAGIGAGTAGR
jgi:hypothetical protein